MNKMKLTGAALALSAAAAFVTAPVFAADADSSATPIMCKGINACKGQGTCKTATNSCKGQNSCKGKGLMSVASEEECKNKGGDVVKNDEAE